MQRQDVAERRTALGEALARTPIRKGSFDRETGMLDSKPRRFSTGAELMPMPQSHITIPNTVQENEMSERRRTDTAARFDICSSTPSIARLAALTSPCYFHKNFDDAVDIEKVLEEIRLDDQLSHSRLMQTAAGVREVSRQLQRRPLKRAVRSVLIITKARDNSLVNLTRELALWLLETPRHGKDIGVNVYVDAKLQKSKRFDAASFDSRFSNMLRYWTPVLCLEKPELFDLVITLGGDGTVLYTSWLFQRIVPPVLSFSLGSLGFLTNFEFKQYKERLNQIMGDTGTHMRVNLRMRFTCTVYRSAASTNEMIDGETHEVLNEVVIDRGPSSYTSSLDLYANNELLTRCESCDGLILATPSGSTAYSLSAGGSLVHPDIPAILLTPICPHTLSFRPMLFNDDMELKVAIPATSRVGAYVSFDGKGRTELKKSDMLVLKASKFPFPTVMNKSSEWFESISRKLKWNTRASEQKAWEGDDGEQEKAEFDIDFDQEDQVASSKDSGYGGGSSESGRA